MTAAAGLLLDELRALSRGIAPPILVGRGLGEALTALAARSTIPIQLNADALDCRPDAAVETAAYFVVAEALTNVVKHSRADNGVTVCGRVTGTNPLSAKPGSSEPGTNRPPNSQPSLNGPVRGPLSQPAKAPRLRARRAVQRKELR